jgi:hypothetical protein
MSWKDGVAPLCLLCFGMNSQNKFTNEISFLLIYFAFSSSEAKGVIKKYNYIIFWIETSKMSNLKIKLIL